MSEDEHILVEENRIIIICTRIPAAFSILCSGYIVYSVLTNAQNRSIPTQRIVLGISCSDILWSFFMFLASWPMPRGTENAYGAVGNTQTFNKQRSDYQKTPQGRAKDRYRYRNMSEGAKELKRIRCRNYQKDLRNNRPEEHEARRVAKREKYRTMSTEQWLEFFEPYAQNVGYENCDDFINKKVEPKYLQKKVLLHGDWCTIDELVAANQTLDSREKAAYHAFGTAHTDESEEYVSSTKNPAWYESTNGIRIHQGKLKLGDISFSEMARNADILWVSKDPDLDPRFREEVEYSAMLEFCWQLFLHRRFPHVPLGERYFRKGMFGYPHGMEKKDGDLKVGFAVWARGYSFELKPGNEIYNY